MATEKNIQIKTLTGDLLFPKTKGAVVINNNGDNLGGVEAGAQVNKIETIKVNGTALDIVSKAVDITLPAYTITKADTADEGFLATYQLYSGETPVGAKINIPKDYLVKSCTLETCAKADEPVEGYAVGDKYIDFVVNVKEGTANASHIYLKVTELVDVYTADGTYITLTNGQFALAIDQVKTAIQDTFYTETEVNTLLNGKQDTIDADHKLGAGLIETTEALQFVSATEKDTWSGKQNAITAAAKLDADLVDDASSAHKFVTADQLTAIGNVANKANDNEVVHLAGEEQVTGLKKFSVVPEVGTAAANDSSVKAASTAFVANAIAGCLTYEELA